MLNIEDHRRDSAGLRYVYPVVSRRANGVSIGINLNVNNACNWACIYCQVPGLTRGAPPPVDLCLLEHELRFFLREITAGNFMETHVPPESRQLRDIAFSGNGEPTSAPGFLEAVVLVEKILHEFSLPESFKVRLITNGSLIHRADVQQGVARIGNIGGEVWFKLDRANEAGIFYVNGAKISMSRIRKSLLICADLAPTWIQTCCFTFKGKGMDERDRADYLEFIKSVRNKIKGVHLYGIVRPSMQTEAKYLSRMTPEKIRSFSRQIMSLGTCVVSRP
jgi:wyosine [tRNA(Phe)-imidazoG37] synthetase (radical SAM superfamily)